MRNNEAWAAAKVLANSPSDQSNAPGGDTDSPWIMVAAIAPVSVKVNVAAADLRRGRLGPDMGNGSPHL